MLELTNSPLLLKTFETVSEESMVKLPILCELHIRIFSFLLPKEQQKLTTVNTFWSQTVIWVARTQQTLRIQKLIFIYQDLFPKEAVGVLNNSCQTLLQDLKGSTLKFYKESICEVKELIVNTLAHANEDTVKNIDFPFLFENVAELSAEIRVLYEQYEKYKLDDTNLIYVSGRLLKKNDLIGAIKIVREIRQSCFKSAGFYDVLEKCLEKGRISLAEMIVEEMGGKDYGYYQLAFAAILKDDERALDFAKKVKKPGSRINLIDKIYAAEDKKRDHEVIALNFYGISYDQLKIDDKKEELDEQDNKLIESYNKLVAMKAYKDAMDMIENLNDTLKKDSILFDLIPILLQNNFLLAEKAATFISPDNKACNPYNLLATAALSEGYYEKAFAFIKKMHPDSPEKLFHALIISFVEKNQFDIAEEITKDRILGDDYYKTMNYINTCKGQSTTKPKPKENCLIQ